MSWSLRRSSSSVLRPTTPTACRSGPPTTDGMSTSTGAPLEPGADRPQRQEPNGEQGVCCGGRLVFMCLRDSNPRTSYLGPQPQQVLVRARQPRDGFVVREPRRDGID